MLLLGGIVAALVGLTQGLRVPSDIHVDLPVFIAFCQAILG